MRLLLLYGLALILRVGYMLSIARDPTFLVPVVDSAVFLDTAERLAGGGGFPEGPLRFGPLYPLLLALLHKVTGGAIPPMHLLQFMITAAGAPLLALVGEKFFGRRAGTLSGILFAVYWPMIYFEGEFLIEPILFVMILALLLLMLKLEERGTLPIAAATGIALGLCVIARPNTLLVLPVWAIWLMIRGRATLAVAMIVGCALPIIPVSVRNMAQGDFALVSSTAGINFFIGNNAEATGRNSTFPGMRQWTFDKVHRRAEMETGGEMKPSEVSRHYFRKAVNFITTDPAAFVSLTARKVIGLVSSYEMPNVKDPDFQRRRSAVLRLPIWVGFGIVAPLAVAGLFARRRLPLTTLALFAIPYSISILAFFVSGRYRVPVLPVLLLLAGPGLALLATAARSRRIPPRGLSVALLIALIAVNWNPLGRLDDESQSNFNVAWAAQKAGDSRVAIEYYQLVGNENAWKPLALNNEAIIHRNAGRYDEAARMVESALEMDPTYFEGWETLGTVHYRANRFEAAEAAFERAATLWPGKVSYHVNLGLARKNAGDLPGALSAFEAAVEVDPTYVKGRAHRAEALAALGRVAETIDDLEVVVQAERTNVAAWRLLTVAYQAAGREGDAIRAFGTLESLDPQAAHDLRRYPDEQ